MKLGMIGLGKMGGNMTERLLQAGHEVVVYDRSPDAVAASVAKGAVGAASPEELAQALPAPRAIWLMVPAGAPVDQTIAALQPHLAPGDAIIDGGNSNYKDTMARGERLEQAGIYMIDAGTSGGIWGLKNGYCLMVGGDAEAVKRIEPIFLALAPVGGYRHVGPCGAGHYVKMVHNGIEYGMLQAYAEGFEILYSKKEFNLDLGSIAALWNDGSVVRSWLLELAELAFEDQPHLESIRDYVEDSGEGRWTVQEAIDLNIPAPVITLSLLSRLTSRQESSFSAKFVAALRNEFGGHRVIKEVER
jgi:6-phosphogluconate dehydrogenase